MTGLTEGSECRESYVIVMILDMDKIKQVRMYCGSGTVDKLLADVSGAG